MGVLDFMAEGSHILKKFWKVAMVLGLMAASAAVTFCITYQELGSALLSTPWTAKTEEISRYLDAYFIDEYDPEQLADGAAAGMIAATGDEWSYYISADDYDAYLEQMNNAYVGIGVTIQAEDGLDGFRIMEVTAGGPADQGGVQVDDVLTHVEGESVTEDAHHYNIVRNHLYGLGSRTMDDPGTGTDPEPGIDEDDDPISLNNKHELELIVNDNWEAIHDMELD